MSTVPPIDSPSRRIRLGTGLALVAVLVVAAVLRLWLLHGIPPGLNNDEGVNALDVERIIGGWRPIFLPANNGREAFFMYTQALVGAALGVTSTTLRLTAALWGILTVGLTFGLVRRWYGDRVGLLASGLLAVAFWHVVLSRIGLRAISVPALYVGVLWAFSEAFWRRRQWLFLLAGALLGLAQYTYISARLLPVIVLIVCLAYLIQEGRQGRPMLPPFRSLCLAALAAVVTVLPEAFYFARHPEQLIGRTDQVLVFNSHPAIIGAPITFQQSLGRTLGMFWVAGDTNWLHNIAGLPALDPVLALFFIVGAGALVVALWRQGRAVRPLASVSLAVGPRPSPLLPPLWLLVWSGVLLAGSSVTQESPNYLRLSALMPAVAAVCAVGVATAGRLILRVLKRRGVQSPEVLPALLVAVLILAEGARTGNLYYRDWAGQGGVYTAFDTDIHDAAAASLQQRDVPAADTFVQLDASSPFIFFRPETTAARWLREYSTVVALPPAGQPALWVYSHFQDVPPLPAYLPQATLVAQGTARPGHPGYFLYRMPANGLTAFRAAFRPLPQPIRFGDSVELLGTQLQTPAVVQPGGSMTVLLLWRVLQPASVNFGLSIHLTDEHGVTWSQSDRQGMMRNGWHTGDEFVSRHQIVIPADTPPVPLKIEASASILDPIHQPAAVLQALGAPVTLTTIHVLLGPPATATPGKGATTVVPGLSLTGTAINQPVVEPGDTLTVTLHWLRSATVSPLTLALSLVDRNGTPVAVSAGDPAYGALPVTALPIGREVADPRILRLPAVLPSEPLRLDLLVTENGVALPPIDLGTVQAKDRQHNFTPPVSQFPISATFGGQIELLGYDLPVTRPQAGDEVPVTLDWRALRTPMRNYTVFVHLLGADGKIAAQNDSPPQHGTLPTLGWLPQEVVSDKHVIDLPSTLPAGSYRLEVGWYDAATNQRLVVDPPAAGSSVVLAQAITVP